MAASYPTSPNTGPLRLSSATSPSGENLFSVQFKGSVSFTTGGTSPYTYIPGKTDLWTFKGDTGEANKIAEIPEPTPSGNIESINTFQDNETTVQPFTTNEALITTKVVRYIGGGDSITAGSLWVTGGTSGTTSLLKDFAYIGSRHLEEPSFSLSGGYAYFRAKDTVDGFGLWRTDGTSQGTIFLLRADEFSNSLGFLDEYDDGNSAFASKGDGTIYFTTDDADHGRELWKSDGTVAGTALIKDIRPGSDSSDIRDMIQVGGEIYFTASDGIHGRELWKTDGTEAGTSLVVDLVPGLTGSGPDKLHAIGSSIYFFADDRIHGNELWMIDTTQPVSLDPPVIQPTTDPTSSPTSDPSLVRAFQSATTETYEAESNQTRTVNGILEVTTRENATTENERYILTAASTLTFNRGYSARSPVIAGSTQDDSIVLNDSIISGGQIDLGEGADKTSFQGRSKISRTTIGLGNDRVADIVTIAKGTQVSGLRVKDFGKQDKLIYNGKTYTYNKLKSSQLKGIKVSFQKSQARLLSLPSRVEGADTLPWMGAAAQDFGNNPTPPLSLSF